MDGSLASRLSAAKYLRYWDEGRHKFVLENDSVKLMAGSSSADVRFDSIVIVNK